METILCWHLPILSLGPELGWVGENRGIGLEMNIHTKYHKRINLVNFARHFHKKDRTCITVKGTFYCFSFCLRQKRLLNPSDFLQTWVVSLD